jgi:hypothetical protein
MDAQHFQSGTAFPGTPEKQKKFAVLHSYLLVDDIPMAAMSG